MIAINETLKLIDGIINMNKKDIVLKIQIIELLKMKSNVC
jgi:hypothetical protein